jgi:hypothetical protein
MPGEAGDCLVTIWRAQWARLAAPYGSPAARHPASLALPLLYSAAKTRSDTMPTFKLPRQRASGDQTIDGVHLADREPTGIVERRDRPIKRAGTNARHCAHLLITSRRRSRSPRRPPLFSLSPQARTEKSSSAHGGEFPPPRARQQRGGLPGRLLAHRRRSLLRPRPRPDERIAAPRVGRPEHPGAAQSHGTRACCAPLLRLRES